ncbi:MAG: hypothetical protein PF636_05620 [Actinomycetota bacterium]|nr:hypothetical protein [Actinomycetota bacterium]
MEDAESILLTTLVALGLIAATAIIGLATWLLIVWAVDAVANRMRSHPPSEDNSHSNS